ncbi:MAG: hypothetical protein CL424_07585 [Acidimicrobiaceae bacterium]|nr:hypothetical protein [Acidimicrobiaceae bacterium]
MARMLSDLQTARPRRPEQTSAGDRPVRVEFVVPPGLAQHAQLIAEFAAWSPIAMDRRSDGSHHASVWLHPGHRWRYQFLLDDRVIVNDPAATTFDEISTGGHISIIRT